ncbi:hypothetical protein ASPZODRAFT_74549 [Penicilliopsis zonata CBS 506.65]|uniref:Uncharacterized protein n=1 Tax=Penicilliopsis zonata CBS 506.65 TaxID=1073090 RepID=A0A1L9S844_9EURO|nr:hypothetical protein ASPZODRAFT_74549 [Penicilliopsis zonata CBS 506.65]OJJ43331.1 hypothetical protein ASPZODRAFT_74549 [Penicilliopsis zonata CBS 506.65]
MRSDLNLVNSKDTLYSVSSSRTPPSQSSHQLSSSLSKNPQPQVLHEQSWVSDPDQLTKPPSQDTISDSLDTFPNKVKGHKSKKHINPLLRQVSGDESRSTSIDLSRSSFEQEGLGIFMNTAKDGWQTDSYSSLTARRTVSGFHNRSTSATSQFSGTSSSSVGKPGSQYVHPMRQTPRSYTPPLNQSCQTSITETNNPELENPSSHCEQAPDNTDLKRPPPFARTPSGQAPRLSLQLNDGSYSRLPGIGISQPSITGRTSFGYSRDNSSVLDTTSPTSRSSLDFIFRSKTRTNTDTLSRAATVQAARQAFEEKEAAKTRKFEEQQIKAEEKENRRKKKQSLRNSTNSDQYQSTFAAEKVSQESTGLPEPTRPSSSPQHQRHRSGSWKSQSKSTWMLFMTWLRTRVFKLRRNALKRR